MALEFRRRRFRMPGKKAQYAIAFAALLVVLAIVFSWMLIEHKLGQMHATSSSDDSSAEQSASAEYTADDKANMLLIFTDEGCERFILLQADPENSRVQVASIPAALYTQDEMTLTAVYRKHGAARAVNAVADALDLPLRHYIAISGEKAVSWFNHLENGLVFNVPQPVDHTAADGSITRLSAGEHNLTAAQTVGILRYTGWSDAALFDKIGAQITVNMLDQYMRPERYLEGDFATLSNLAQTSLRIGDYNDARAMLSHLADNNTGSLGKVVILPVKTSEAEQLTLDLQAIKKQALFHNN